MTLVQERELVGTGMPLVELVVNEQDADRDGWLQARLEDVLRIRPQVVRVELRACAAISSGMLRTLLDVHCELHRQGGLLELTGLSPRLVRTIGLAGLDGVFVVRPAVARSSTLHTPGLASRSGRSTSASLSAAS